MRFAARFRAGKKQFLQAVQKAIIFTNFHFCKQCKAPALFALASSASVYTLCKDRAAARLRGRFCFPLKQGAFLSHNLLASPPAVKRGGCCLYKTYILYFYKSFIGFLVNAR